MASAVSICSNALIMLGSSPINSMDEGTDRARAASNLYPDIRDMVLRSHPWNCATKRVQLAPETAKPAFGYSNKFLLPGDWLRTLDTDKVKDFQVEGRFILANTNLLNLRYIFRNEIESTWDALLVRAVTVCMRQAFAYPTTTSTSLEAMISQELEPLLAQARTVDGQENPPETFGEDRLYRAGF